MIQATFYQSRRKTFPRRGFSAISDISSFLKNLKIESLSSGVHGIPIKETRYSIFCVLPHRILACAHTTSLIHNDHVLYSPDTWGATLTGLTLFSKPVQIAVWFVCGSAHSGVQTGQQLWVRDSLLLAGNQQLLVVASHIVCD